MKNRIIVAARNTALVALATVLSISAQAAAIEPNSFARNAVKRDLRIYALKLNEITALTQQGDVLVDLTTMPTAKENQALAGYNKVYFIKAGKTLEETVSEVNRQYPDAISGAVIIQLISKEEIRVIQWYTIPLELRKRALKPGDVLIVRESPII